MDTIFGTQGNITSSWEPEPLRRGTFSILSTSLVTLSLCVITAVHLNIPEYGKANQQARLKLGWMIMATIAPEFIVFTAFTQYQGAKKILNLAERSEICRLSTPWWNRALLYIKQRLRNAAPLEDPEIDQTTDRRLLPLWTMVHGHYFAMGGLAVEFRPYRRVERYIIDVETFNKFLSELPESIPAITEEEIMDKSKANGLAKALVCLQAGWFCVQCVNRIFQGLSISLLELSTLGHSLCALLMYLLWWDKPLNIQEPTILRDESAVGFVATAVADRRNFQAAERVRNSKYDGIQVAMSSKTPATVLVSGYGERGGAPPSGSMRLYMGQSVHGIQYERQNLKKYKNKNTKQLKPSNGILSLSRPYITLSEDDLLDWELVRTAKESLGNEKDFPKRVKNWPAISLAFWSPLETFRDIYFMTGITIAGFTYGALHMIAPFHTPVELLLWHITALYTLLFGPTIFLIMHLADITDAIWDGDRNFWLFVIIKDKTKPLRKVKLIGSFLVFVGDMWRGLMGRGERGTFPEVGLIIFVVQIFFQRLTADLVCHLMIGLYVLSRVYLVVECFLQINHLPESVFSVPTWSQYVPHVS